MPGLLSRVESLLEAKPIVAVTMSTGLQGQSVVRHLSQTGNYRIRALTRNPFSKTAIKLAKLPNVEVIKADLLDKSSLEDAFRDADVIFGNTTPTTSWKIFRGSMLRKYEIAQGRNLVEAVKTLSAKGKLKHFIFSSVCKPKDPFSSNPEPGHFSSKWDIEELIINSDLIPLTTFLRPVSYFENFYSRLPGVSISKSVFPGVVHPDYQWQTIAVDDVGLWTKAIIANRNKFLGEAINIAGEELTGNQMAEIIKDSLGEEYLNVNILWSLEL